MTLKEIFNFTARNPNHELSLSIYGEHSGRNLRSNTNNLYMGKFHPNHLAINTFITLVNKDYFPSSMRALRTDCFDKNEIKKYGKIIDKFVIEHIPIN